MSHHAHGTRRSRGHASRTRDMDTGSTPRVNLYQELHPEMFMERRPTLRGRQLSDDERKAAIVADLRTHGPSTAQEIAFRLGINIRRVSLYLATGIDGVVVVGKEKNQVNRSYIKVWGVRNGISE